MSAHDAAEWIAVITGVAAVIYVVVVLFVGRFWQ